MQRDEREEGEDKARAREKKAVSPEGSVVFQGGEAGKVLFCSITSESKSERGMQRPLEPRDGNDGATPLPSNLPHFSYALGSEAFSATCCLGVKRLRQSASEQRSPQQAGGNYSPPGGPSSATPT